MIRIFVLTALCALTLPVYAMADDYERERDIIRSTPMENGDCDHFNDCNKDNRARRDTLGKTEELNNGFDKDGRGSRRTLSDNVLDQLSPASGR